jgi:hypothetical protein
MFQIIVCLKLISQCSSGSADKTDPIKTKKVYGVFNTINLLSGNNNLT